MDSKTLAYYEQQAATLAAHYAAADMTHLHRLLLAHLPPRCRVLEIGSGTCRDAAFLAGQGFDVTATDASSAMLAQSRVVPDSPGFRRLKASFPLPLEHSLLSERFDAVIALAVVMHLPDADLFEFAYQLRALLNPGGVVILSCSEGHERNDHGRDPQGRLFRERPPAELTLLFERIGFRLVRRDQNDDGLGRSDVRWNTMVLRLDHDAGSRPVDQIETIIHHDKKDATYKLALLRALCEIAQTAYRFVRWHEDNTVSLPLGLIAEKWLYYYWPLIDTGKEPIIPQKRGLETHKPIAFRKDLTALAAHYHGQNGLSRFHGEFVGGTLDPVARKLTDAALNTIANTIVVGPVQFASQGCFEFRGRHRTARNRCYTPQALYDALGRIHFDADVWREFCLLGHWIGEAIILRWAELTVEISKREIPFSRVLEKLLIRPETERDVATARAIYKAAPHLACVWTHVSLDDRRFDVDHAIPFSLWHNNELWNLVPANPRVNNIKRDRLVSRDTLLESREAIIDAWQTTRGALPGRFDFEISRTLFGRRQAESQWEAPAFAALVEAIETIALQRGVERWAPVSVVSGTGIGGLQAERTSVSTFAVPPAGSEKKTHVRTGRLPLVAALAAGPFFDGFATRGLDAAADCDWVNVPEELCKTGRFVIRVAGDSMEPLFRVGDLLVFEYHRTPRCDGQIVIAADFTDGITTGTYAIKRFRAHPDNWVFASENPAYKPVQIPRHEMKYPILGTFVKKLEGAKPSDKELS